MPTIRDVIAAAGIYDTHSHIGSLPSVAANGDWHGFPCDLRPCLELPDTGLFDLLFAPYLGGLLASLGHPRPDRATFLDDTRTGPAGWAQTADGLSKTRTTGLYLALQRAFHDLYATSLDDLVEGRSDPRTLTRKISARYRSGMFRWAREAFAAAGITVTQKPIHLPFLARLATMDSETAALERGLFEPLLRIDDLLGRQGSSGRLSWPNAEDAFRTRVAVPDDLGAMVGRSFDLAARTGVRSIKQAQAYRRSLDFDPPDASEVPQLFPAATVTGQREAVRKLQNHILGLVLERASAVDMPMQVHTGMANLPDSNPVLLQGTLRRYPKVRFVLLHCYPYLSEAAYLARTFPNVYLDTAWLVLQSPGTLAKALSEWIGFVPHTKIFLSGDATSVEEAYGAAMMNREVLASVLDDKIARGEMSLPLAQEVAHCLLHRNAAEFYRASGSEG